jgi:dephospho-CoA kinase
MMILGLTGSIAMGKSTITDMFAEAGIPTTNADSIVHDLLANDRSVIAQVTQHFPEAQAGEAIDRKKLGARVFGDLVAMRVLEGILHPKVRAVEVATVLREQKNGAWLVVLDIPLLFETGADARVDKVLVVTASPKVQRERVMARPGMTEERFADIASRQMPDAEKRKRADYLVETDKGLEHSRVKVQLILDELKELAKKQ